MNALGSERVAVVGMIDPDQNAAATHTTDYVSMARFSLAMAIIALGTMESGSTVDAKLVQATDSSGTGKKDITGKAITQLTQAGSDSDKQAIIDCRAEELDVDGGFTHVALEVTVASAASDSAGILLGLDPRHGPVSAFDLASVAEIVN